MKLAAVPEPTTYRLDPTVEQRIADLPALLSMKEAIALSGLGRDKAYRSARSFLSTGQGLPCVRITEQTLMVPTKRFLAWLGLDQVDA